MNPNAVRALLHEDTISRERGSSIGDRAQTLVTRAGPIILVGGIVGVVWLRFSQLSVAEAPPGADGGDWLAFAYQFAGVYNRAADVVSPPVVPLLIWILTTFVSPLAALKIVAVFSSIAIAVPIYLMLRRELPTVLAAILALTLTLTGYHGETMAWGGYPQLLGVAFLSATLLTLGKGLATGTRFAIIVSGLCAALTLGSHQLAAIALVLAVPIFIACSAVQAGSVLGRLQSWRHQLGLWVAATVAFSLPFVPFYVRIIALSNGSPANPQGYRLSNAIDAVIYAFRDDVLLWTLLSLGSAAFCLWVVASRQESQLAASAVALMVASLVIFAALYEVRALYVFQVGVIAGVGVLVAALLRRSSPRSLGFLANFVGGAATVLALLIASIALSTRGVDRSQETMAYYRVVDGPSLRALLWLGQHSSPDSLVVAGQTDRGGPYSWWVEGLSRRPAYSTNIKFLRGYNRDEQAQILYAMRLLSPSTSATDANQLIAARRIKYFFINKSAAQEFAYVRESVPMQVVFENQEIEILSPTVP